MTVLDPVATLTAWDLQVAVTVVERGSLIAAAQALQISQSSVSRTISRLEKSLNIELFARSTRRTDPTLPGLEFARVAERVLNDLHLAIANMQNVADEKRGQVLISTFPQVAQEILPPIIAAYRKSRAKTEIHVRTGTNSEVVADVSSGLVDLGITVGDVPHDAVEAIEVKRDTLCALIPEGHELAKAAEPLPFAQLDGALMVSLPRGAYTRQLIDEAATACRITFNHAVVVPGFLEQLTHAQAGVGIALVPTSTVSGHFLRQVTVSAIHDPQLVVSIKMLSLRGRYMSPAAISFRSMLIDAMRSGMETRKAS